MNYLIKTVPLAELLDNDLREEALADTTWQPVAYRIHVEDGQVLEAVHYATLNLLVTDSDAYDVDGNLDAAIRQAIAATEPEAWSLEK